MGGSYNPFCTCRSDETSLSIWLTQVEKKRWFHGKITIEPAVEFFSMRISKDISQTCLCNTYSSHSCFNAKINDNKCPLIFNYPLVIAKILSFSFSNLCTFGESPDKTDTFPVRDEATSIPPILQSFQSS